MTEIRKEMASILRKLRNLGYENYELVRTSKEVQCCDLDGYPFHIYGQLGENIPVKDVLDLVGAFLCELLLQYTEDQREEIVG